MREFFSAIAAIAAASSNKDCCLKCDEPGHSPTNVHPSNCLAFSPSRAASSWSLSDKLLGVDLDGLKDSDVHEDNVSSCIALSYSRARQSIADGLTRGPEIVISGLHC